MNLLVDGLTDGKGLVTNLAATAIWAVAGALVWWLVKTARRLAAWTKEWNETSLWSSNRLKELAKISAHSTISPHAIAYLQIQMETPREIAVDSKVLAVLILALSIHLNGVDNFRYVEWFFQILFLCCCAMSTLADRRAAKMKSAVTEGLEAAIFVEKSRDQEGEKALNQKAGLGDGPT